MYQKQDIEEHCYRIGVPVDVYFRLIEQIYNKEGYTPEQAIEKHRERLSRLERMAEYKEGCD